MPFRSWRSTSAREPRLLLKISFCGSSSRSIRSARFVPDVPTIQTRLAMVLLSRQFDWRNALMVVKPKTFLAWHHKGFRLFWRWKSKYGRRPIPSDLQHLIRRMARENPSWGEERIANQFLLKLGLRVSPRTVRRYLPKLPPPPPGQPRGHQHWATFLKNHARFIVACDLCVAVMATFRFLYVFVALEHASRRILCLTATAHPTAAWTLQQLRQTIPSDHKYRSSFTTTTRSSPLISMRRWRGSVSKRSGRRCAARRRTRFASA